MPQSQRFNQSVAIGGSADLLDGRALQDVDRRFTRGATVTLYTSQDTGDGTVSVSVGTDTPIQTTTPNVRTAAVTNQQEDLIGSFFVSPGDRIRMSANNPGAGATEFRVLMLVQGN